MKWINKKLIFATKHKEWYDKNENASYNSTNHPFYYDVYYELLLHQEGLCAYTEMRLIDEEKLQQVAQNFINGRYSSFRVSVPADIEHFSKSKKKDNGWLYDNLFVVFNKVNNEKNKLEDKYGIDDILKPDLVGYFPEKFLEYDESEHVFIPLNSLEDELFDRVNNMIIVLGLNNDFVKRQRRNYLCKIKIAKEFMQPYNPNDEFVTAYKMYFAQNK